MADTFKEDKRSDSAETLKDSEPSFNELMNKRKKKPYIFVENEADRSLDSLSETKRRGFMS